MEHFIDPKLAEYRKRKAAEKTKAAAWEAERERAKRILATEIPDRNGFPLTRPAPQPQPIPPRPRPNGHDRQREFDEPDALEAYERRRPAGGRRPCAGCRTLVPLRHPARIHGSARPRALSRQPRSRWRPDRVRRA